jgi:excisionase family DNA binding protein
MDIEQPKVMSVYKLAQEGRIPCQKVGRHWRFHKAALDAWLSQGFLGFIEANPREQ